MKAWLRMAAWCLGLGLAARAAADDGWQLGLGGGLAARPKYPGSDALQLRPVPAFDLRYGRWFFSSGEGLGLYLARKPRCWISAAVAPELGHRYSRDDDHLRGLDDVQGTARAVLKAGYRLGWISATAGLASDIAGRGQGTLADFELAAQQELLPGLRLEGGTGLRWANRQYRETFFGIDARESAASGLPAFSAGSGVDSLRLFAGATYQLDRHWSLAGRASLAWLQGDSADSPVTEQKTQPQLALFALYRF
jgi:outer membrane protein